MAKTDAISDVTNSSWSITPCFLWFDVLIITDQNIANVCLTLRPELWRWEFESLLQPSFFLGSMERKWLDKIKKKKKTEIKRDFFQLNLEKEKKELDWIVLQSVSWIF